MLNRKKTGCASGVVKLENRLLRFLRSDIGFQNATVSIEGKSQELSYESREEIEKAMLAAEYNRAKANMASQQARSCY